MDPYSQNPDPNQVVPPTEPAPNSFTPQVFHPQTPAPQPAQPVIADLPTPVTPLAQTTPAFRAPGPMIEPTDVLAPQPTFNPMPSSQIPGVIPNNPGNVAPAAGFMGGEGFSPNTFAGEKKPKRRKKLLLLIGVPILVLLLGGGYVFAFYLPNKPQNVWNTGLSRSGQAIQKIVDSATEKQQVNAFKKSDITTTVEASYGKTSFNGTANAKFDTTKLDGSLSFKAKESGSPDIALSAKLLSSLPEGSQYPNIYMQFTGLKALGIDTFLPGATDYDGKWIALDADYLKTLSDVPTAQEQAKKQLTSEDYSELARAVTSVTTEYVFTSNTQKAVFVKKEYKGKEKVDGVQSFHYTVGINVDHEKAYCRALVDKLYSTTAYKKLPWVNADNVDKDKEDAKKSCDDDMSSGKDTTFDLWIDAKYKLIHKIRITDTKEKGTYTDVGQTYKGGDDISMFVAYHSDKQKVDGSFTVDTNMKTGVTKAVIDVKGGGVDAEALSIKVTLDAKPYTGEINADKPAGAVPIQDVMKRFGFDPSELTGGGSELPVGSSSSALNVERQTDIKALHAQLEAYFAQHGKYPTLLNMNDAGWRKANMKGLDDAALKDPKGTSTTLTAKATVNSYSYDVTNLDNKACNNSTVDCDDYTLTATLDGGGTYVKNSLASSTN